MRPATRIAGLVAAQIQAQRTRLRLAAAGGAIVAVAAVCLLGLSGWFITGAALAGATGAVAAQGFNYMTPSAIIRLLAILRTGARYVERVAGHEAALKALARLRPQLFDAIASGPAGNALGVSSGELSARLVQDMDAVQTLFVRRSAPWSLGAGAAGAVALAALATPLAGGALLAAMILTFAGGAVFARRLSNPAGRAVQAAVGRLKDRLAVLEAVSPELKAYGLETWAAEQVSDVATRHDDARMALTLAGGWMAAWQTLATAVAVALVVPATVGAALPMTALAALAAVMGVDAASGLIGALHQDGGAAEAMARLDAVVPARPAARAQMRPADRLRLPAGVDDAPPFRLGLFGPSGAGKTTLIERLSGLRDALTGEAFLGDVDVADIPAEARRALFAYAAQDVRLLDGTIRQNLLLAGPADDALLWRALDDAVLGDRVRADPRGLDAPVGADGGRLSGGERRRLGLARAFLRDAPWLLLDEPTEGLDAESEARVLSALDRRLVERGQGLILVSHRIPPMAICDRLIAVEGMAADGRARLARANPSPRRGRATSPAARSAARATTAGGSPPWS